MAVHKGYPCYGSSIDFVHKISIMIQIPAISFMTSMIELSSENKNTWLIFSNGCVHVNP